MIKTLRSPRGLVPLLAQDELYATLRAYQKGELEASNGIAVGQLTIGLSTLYDQVLEIMASRCLAR